LALAKKRKIVGVISITLAVVGNRSLSAPAAATTQPSAATQPSTGAQAPSGIDLTQLSLEDLMHVKVTSVSKQSQKISEAPAAVSVIGQDDIQRSGMESIPELLRLAPGMDVAQINANSWAITARGMNGFLADDLLVLMDGRSLYSPAFGGVTWNAVGYPLQDIDRIEVIRGPGSTLWGSNAVNGVVNIISKSAQDTQGLLVDARGGTQQDQGTVRYGGQIDDDTYYRVYSQYQYTGSNDDSSENPAHDEWQGLQSGFRIDRIPSSSDTLTLQGDFFEQQADEMTTSLLAAEPYTYYENGGDILGRWTHTESDRADSSLQAYYDRQVLTDFPAGYEQDTLDAQFQNRLPLGAQQELTWGLGARDHFIRITSQPPVTFQPVYTNEYILNGFLQDQITLVPDRLQWYIGSKLEYNSLTYLEVQPSTRLLWTPDQRNSFWAAVSRSVRIPSVYEDSNINIGPVAVTTDDPEAENTLSYELGYKLQPAKTVTMDVTGFYNSYNDLIITIPDLEIPGAVEYANAASAQSYGGELSLNWQATPDWRLSASYSYLAVDAQNPRDNFAEDFTPQYELSYIERSSPRNQFQIHSYQNLTDRLQLNASLYFVDDLKTVNEGVTGGFQDVPDYVRLDVNLRWAITANMSLTVGVQNALQTHHIESGSVNGQVAPSEVPRTVFADWTMKL
jgi:iron complex outermembrane receptor protein